MQKLSNVLEIVKHDSILGSDTALIDATLASAQSDQIPADNAASVITYIDLQLAHNNISQEIRDGLTKLYDELQIRRGKG